VRGNVLTPGAEWWPDILEEHLEKLESLWTRRLRAVRSSEWSGRALAKLDDRIEAHTDALELAGEEALPVLVPGDRSDSAPAVAAAALPLARMGGEEAGRLLAEAFHAAEGEALEGFRIALCQVQDDHSQSLLETVAVEPSEEHAAVALAVLAFRRRLSSGGRLGTLIQSRSAGVRRVAWEAVALLGPRTARGPGAEGLRFDLLAAFRYGLTDADPMVRASVRLAAAWTRQGWLLAALRKAADRPSGGDVGALRLLAILARSEDVARMRTVAADASLGPGRFALLASLGHVAAVEDLVSAMGSGDPATAAAAGAAFQRMTGIAAGSGDRVRQFLPEVELPDVALARNGWAALRRRVASATRLCRGVDVSRGAPPSALADLDRESLWELKLRECFEKKWDGGPADLERLPQLSV